VTVATVVCEPPSGSCATIVTRARSVCERASSERAFEDRCRVSVFAWPPESVACPLASVSTAFFLAPLASTAPSVYTVIVAEQLLSLPGQESLSANAPLELTEVEVLAIVTIGTGAGAGGGAWLVEVPRTPP
jgi:hypothetical protein